jgi:hypothetical protein
MGSPRRPRIPPRSQIVQGFSAPLPPWQNGNLGGCAEGPWVSMAPQLRYGTRPWKMAAILFRDRTWRTGGQVAPEPALQTSLGTRTMGTARRSMTSALETYQRPLGPAIPFQFPSITPCNPACCVNVWRGTTNPVAGTTAPQFHDSNWLSSPKAGGRFEWEMETQNRAHLPRMHIKISPRCFVVVRHGVGVFTKLALTHFIIQ